MKKIFSYVLLVLLCLVFLIEKGSAQKNDSSWKSLDSNRKRESMKERLREMKKEKIRYPRRDTTKNQGNSQSKTTGNDQSLSGITDPDEGESEVSLAVSLSDSNKIVVSFMYQGMTMPLDFPVYYSSDGGKSWSSSSFSPLFETMNQFPNLFPIGGGDPVFAWDKTGRVYMSWLYLISDMNMDTMFAHTMWAYSDNSGKDWSMEQAPDNIICTGAMNMNEDMFPNYEGMADRQWLAVDNTNGPNQGTLYCSYMYIPGDEDMTKFGVGFKVKKKTQTAFGPTVTAFNSETQFANVEVDKDGKVHVSFADLFTNQTKHVSSTDAGQTFSSDHLIATGQQLFGGNAILHDRENAATNLAIDRNGNLHVVWSDFTSTKSMGFYARSTDGGNTWSSPLDLVTKGGYQHVLMPTVAADADVSVSFMGVDSKDSANYYQINSTTSGASFGDPVKISSTATYYGEYTSGEFFGDYNRSVRAGCMDYAAWTDGRKSAGPKVYFASTNQCTLGVKDITAINSSFKLLALYPNPATENLNISFQSSKAGSIQVSINDVTGRKLFLKEYNINTGTQEIKIPVGQVTGNAVLSIHGSDGLILSRNITIQ